MDFGSLFTDFDGRINRQPFWIGVLVLAVAAMVGSFVLLPVLSVLLWASPALGQWQDGVALDLEDAPTALAVARDGRIAVAGSNSIELRDQSGALLGSFVFGAMPEGCCVRDLAFAGATLLIARSPSWEDRQGAGGTLGGLYRWDGGPDTAPQDLPVGGCSTIAVAPETQAVATACAGAVQLWDLASSAEPTIIHDRPAAAIALNDAGTRLAVADPLPEAAETAGEDAPAVAPVRLYALDEDMELLAEVVPSGLPVRQLAFLGDGRLLSLDASGAISITEPGKWTSRVVAENGPLSGEAGTAGQVALSPDGRLLAGDFGGAEGGVLIDLETGDLIEMPAALPMRGAGHWAFVGEAGLLWAGRPPTFPGAILRWFDVPPIVELSKPLVDDE